MNLDRAALSDALARHEALLAAAALQLPDGHLRAALLRARDLCARQRGLLAALETASEADAAQVLAGFGDVAALLQEVGEDYDRELLQRVLDVTLSAGSDE